MTDNVDFKAAKEWAKARKDARLSEVRNVARAIMALCELLKDQSQYVEHGRVNHRECPGCNEMAKCTCGLKEVWERVDATGA